MKQRMTITEALAEVKLIQKKVTKKEETVLQNLCRFSNQADPFIGTGGAAKAMESEVQAIFDLQTTLERIRAAIAEANLKEKITLGETTRSVHEWLTWKREVSSPQINFVKQIAVKTKQTIDKESQSPTCFKDPEGKLHLAQVVTNLDYPAYLKKWETLSDQLQSLDGKLSLKNATTVIEF